MSGSTSRSAAQDGLMNAAALKQLTQDSLSAADAVDPTSVWDARCSVVEPSPPRAHYLLAVAMATFKGRRWIAALHVKHWLHAYPRLVTSEWDDDDTTGLVGMRWGIGFTTGRVLPTLLCLTDALCGRFDWVIFLDDDTAVDTGAIESLLTSSIAALAASVAGGDGTFAHLNSSAEPGLTRIDPSQPHFLGFGPQPWPYRTKRRNEYRPTMRGCIGHAFNATERRGSAAARIALPSLDSACTGEPVPMASPQRNLHVMWPYGGIGYLLSHAAARSLGGHNSTDAAGCDAPRRSRRGAHRQTPLQAASASFGSMRGDANADVATCLSQLTCPWGEARPCSLLPPPFNHSSGRTALSELDAPPHERWPGFCPRKMHGRHGVDCRSCAGGDVQVACCLATRGIFMTDVSPLDVRIRPSGMGNVYWSPWGARLAGHRKDPAQFEKALTAASVCGLGVGPQRFLTCGKPGALSSPADRP